MTAFYGQASNDFTTIPGAEQWYEHIIVDQEWYIHAKEDGVLSNRTPLFAIRGKAKVGQAAVLLIKEGDQWLPWSFNDETIITGDSKAPLSKVFPPEPQPLHKFLFFLEAQGFVKVGLLFHDVVRKVDTPGRFTVTATETAALEVKPLESTPKNPSLAHIGNMLDLSRAKASSHTQVVHQLRLD